MIPLGLEKRDVNIGEESAHCSQISLPKVQAAAKVLAQGRLVASSKVGRVEHVDQSSERTIWSGHHMYYLVHRKASNY
jgi:hypothetical protein